MTAHRVPLTTRVVAVTGAVALTAVAACTSSASPGRGGATASSARTGGSTTAPAPAHVDAATLGRLMRSGVGSVRSAHVQIDVNAVGQSITGGGDEQLHAGKVVAMEMTTNVPSFGSIELIVAGGKTYAKLPASLNKTGKPFVLVSPTSSNLTVRTLASSLQTGLSAASLDSYQAFVDAAGSLRSRGSERIAGVTTTHYAMTVKVADLPDSVQGKQTLQAAGVNTLPVDLWVDHRGRPIQVSENLSVQGEQVTSKAVITNYDEPVSITAPPPGQVAD